MINDADEHESHAADGLEESLEAFNDNSECSSDDGRSFQSADDGLDSETVTPRPMIPSITRPSPLQHVCGVLEPSPRGIRFHNIDSVLADHDTAIELASESAIDDALYDQDSALLGLASPSHSEMLSTDSDDDSDDDDYICSHCDFLNNPKYAFHRSRPLPPPSIHIYPTTPSILSTIRCTIPPRTWHQRTKFLLPLSPSSTSNPNPTQPRTVTFTASTTKHFSPTAPTWHITCIPPLPHSPTDTPSHLRTQALYRRRHSHDSAPIQVRFRRVAAAAAPHSRHERSRRGAMAATKRSAVAHSAEVMPPFTMKLGDAEGLEDLLDAIQEEWPAREDGVEAIDGGALPMWPPEWVRLRLMEVGKGKRKGKGNGREVEVEEELVDCKEWTRLGGFKRWLRCERRDWWEWEHVLGEYRRLVGVWRMAERERVEALRVEKERRGGWWIGVASGRWRGKESGESLRRRFAKGKVVSVVELLWD